MGKVYSVGTRTSPLALKQVEEIESKLQYYYYPKIHIEIIGFDTYGDKDKITSISDIEGTDFFTKEIDNALVKSEIDFAIHSAKDLPDVLAEGVRIAAITESIDIYDVLVSKHNFTVDTLPAKAKVGTSSKRRKLQLENYRPDIEIRDIRGNINERLSIWEDSDLDAIVIAAAGLIRLGLEDKISQRIPLSIMQPHPLQGALAIVVNVKNEELCNVLKVLDKRESREIYSVNHNGGINSHI